MKPLIYLLLALVHLAMALGGTDTVSSSSSSNKSTTTSASSKDTAKNTTTESTQRKQGLCCNPGCRQCTMVPCNDHNECKIFGFATCCPSPPHNPTNFSRNVIWGYFEDGDCYVLRKRVLHQSGRTGGRP